MNRPILVGIDRSEAAEAALEWAAAEAARRGAALRLLHAFPWPLLAVPVDPRDTGAWTDAERLVESAKARAVSLAPGIEVSSEIADDRPSAALLHAAEEAALLVVGTRGHGGFAGLLLGSTALQVAGHASCPVVVASGRPGAEAGDVAVAVGSRPAEGLLAAAFEEAALHGTGLRVIHAMHLRDDAGFDDGARAHGGAHDGPAAAAEAGRPAGNGTSADDRSADDRAANGTSRVRRRAEQEIGAMLSPWRDRHPEVSVSVDVIDGRAGHVLVEASRKARLLVVGAREHHGLMTSGLGSVTHTVLHHAHCPVLVARSA